MVELNANREIQNPYNQTPDFTFELKKFENSTTLDFSPYQSAEVHLLSPLSNTENLPGLGISQGPDLFLPDVQIEPAYDFKGEQRLAQRGHSAEISVAPSPPSDGSEQLKPAQPKTSDLPANARIALAAERNAEAKPWVGSRYEPQVQNGRLAGAAAVSMVLQDIGYDYADSANVGKLSSQLEQKGWQKVPLDQAKPGDVIYGGRLGKDWRAGGGNAHIGIVGQDGKVWHNDSKTGNWQADSVASSFPPEKYGEQVWVLRPPQSDVPNIPVPNGPVRPDRPHPPSPGRDHRPRPHYVPDDVTPRPDDYSPRPGDDPNIRPEDSERNIEANKRILKKAAANVDRRLWAQSDFANSVKGGRLGCAASVSEVLKMSGLHYANSAGVGGLVDILKQQGWTRVPLSQAQAGDVVYGGKPGTRWWEGGGNAHIGVVGEDGQVFHNSSGRKRWVQDNLTTVFNSKRFGDNRWALRPPRNG